MLTVFAGLAGLGLGLSLITTTMLLTWLNPHVYIDTVVMLASIAATHGDERSLTAGGAVAASLVWFTALGSAPPVSAACCTRRRPGASSTR
ncbi:LysE family transporter [Microbacterium sp. GXF6406]